MKKINLLKNYLDSCKEEKSNGIELRKNKEELTIKGKKSDLLELADYIIDIALSDENKDHLHIDENILISNSSSIKELIIEKE